MAYHLMEERPSFFQILCLKMCSPACCFYDQVLIYQPDVIDADTIHTHTHYRTHRAGQEELEASPGTLVRAVAILSTRKSGALLIVGLATLVLASAQEHSLQDETSDMSLHSHSALKLLSSPGRVQVMAAILTGVVLMSLVGCMMHQGANALRTPPGWGPEQEASYSFRQWSRDVLLWSIASDLEPARKAACVMLVLRGAAKEVARQIPPKP